MFTTAITPVGAIKITKELKGATSSADAGTKKRNGKVNEKLEKITSTLAWVEKQLNYMLGHVNTTYKNLLNYRKFFSDKIDNCSDADEKEDYKKI